MPISANVRFWLYLPVLIPSVLCSIFVLYHLLANRVLRQALNNHVVILIVFLSLVMELTDVIWLAYYYRVRMVLISAPAFCLIWIYVDVAGFITISILVAWASIERHILIFHDHWVSTKRQRIFVHYLPLIILLLYPLIFYAVLFFVISCEEPLSYSIVRCGYSYCALYIPIIGKFDSVANNMMPICIIVTFSLFLIIRVIWQKHHLRQRIHWRNYRKMAIQLLSISSIYIFLYFPPTVLYIAYVSGVSLSDDALDYYGSSLYFTPHIIMLNSFVCAVSLPELRTKINHYLLCCQRPTRAVHPEHIGMTNNMTAQIAKSPLPLPE